MNDSDKGEFVRSCLMGKESIDSVYTQLRLNGMVDDIFREESDWQDQWTLLLKKWSSQRGSSATYNALETALRACSYEQAAESLRALFHPKTSATKPSKQTGKPSNDTSRKITELDINRFTLHVLKTNVNRSTLAPALDLPASTVRNCESRYDDMEKWTNLMEAWLSKNGSNATLGWLKHALRQCGYNESAEWVHSQMQK